jgi:hypothetical protein
MIRFARKSRDRMAEELERRFARKAIPRGRADPTAGGVITIETQQ